MGLASGFGGLGATRRIFGEMESEGRYPLEDLDVSMCWYGCMHLDRLVYFDPFLGMSPFPFLLRS